MIGIYKITNPNGKIYIGQSIMLDKRKFYYSKLRCKSQRKLYNSLVKYGWESHNFEILELCNESDLDKKELFYMEKYNSFGDNGLNLRIGGRTGRLNDETRKKMSQAAIGRFTSKETRLNISKNTKGIKKTLTDEQRRQMSIRMKQINTGRKLSEESKQKLRLSRIGVPRPDWVRKKVSEGRKDKKSILLIKDCAIIEIESLTLASKIIKRDRKTINQAILKGYTCNGYKIYYS